VISIVCSHLGASRCASTLRSPSDRGVAYAQGACREKYRLRRLSVRGQSP
jgi:hypothetical protein